MHSPHPGFRETLRQLIGGFLDRHQFSMKKTFITSLSWGLILGGAAVFFLFPGARIQNKLVENHRTASPDPVPAVLATATFSTQPAARPVSAGLPLRIRIPAIQVNAPVESMGLKKNGEMAVPAGPKEVSWYKLGPRPGQAGNAIISGHYGWRDGIRAAFDNLRVLKRGEIVRVDTADGKTLEFKVRESRLYKYTENPPEIYKAADSGAHLVLITCSGTWIKAKKTYANRLVVFADLIGPKTN